MTHPSPRQVLLTLPKDLEAAGPLALPWPSWPGHWDGQGPGLSHAPVTDPMAQGRG